MRGHPLYLDSMILLLMKEAVAPVGNCGKAERRLRGLFQACCGNPRLLRISISGGSFHRRPLFFLFWSFFLSFTALDFLPRRDLDASGITQKRFRITTRDLKRPAE